MKIKKVTEYHIEFDNGSKITFDHAQQCCECNYADFEQLEDLAKETEFKEPLDFEGLEYGFRFGNKPSKMFLFHVIQSKVDIILMK